MTQPLRTTIMAMSHPRIIRGKVIWPWLKLTEAQRKAVDDHTKGEHFDATLFRRILDQRRKP